VKEIVVPRSPAWVFKATEAPSGLRLEEGEDLTTVPSFVGVSENGIIARLGGRCEVVNISGTTLTFPSSY